MSLPTSPTSPAVMSQAAKDAQFLLKLFRESPTPIQINIGPYATKTGAKPNTIIKRLAGIKARNNLNIKTTQGEYRPSGTGISPRPAKAAKRKTEPASPVSIDERPLPQPIFKAESQPDKGTVGVVVKSEPPHGPLTPVSSRTQSVYAGSEAAAGGSPAPVAAFMGPSQQSSAGVKRQHREWDEEFLL